MAKKFSEMEDSNPSNNASIHDVSTPSRRGVLSWVATAASLGAVAPWLTACAAVGAPPASSEPLIGFKGVPPSTADTLVVPDGYTATPFAQWGESVGLAGIPQVAWKRDGSNTADEQATQLGMHHDGMHFFALGGSKRGVLVMNHEYTDDGMLHVGGMNDWSLAKVRKAQAAHGISVIEIEDAGAVTGAQAGTGWKVVRPSALARRITANTPCAVQGPAAGHPLMRTAADPAGRTVLGTINNCAAGKTPWGTYLSGEENFRYYFASKGKIDTHQKRWGLTASAYFRWPEFDPRFDAAQNPNEFHRFGWVVEVDPMDPTAAPIKRTAMGRAAHEGAWVATTQDGRAVVYSGEDARFEYIYKFVSKGRIQSAGNGLTQAQANRTLLDTGTLYVARFDANGTGEWLPLVHGTGPLVSSGGFADQGEVVIKARQASDALKATKMDRPEWVAINPATREVFCTLTNNTERGATGKPGVDAANPRANNAMGHIIRWQETKDFDATTFTWNHLVLAGDPQNARPDAKGNVKGDTFACPDGISIDARGVLWVQTDAHAKDMNAGEFVPVGNNQMLACDPKTGEMRRFLTGPRGCEITGATFTPDGRTLFINVQHPGEPASDRTVAGEERKISNWPDFLPDGKPRSSTVVIQKRDGGVVGT